ncbi:unnamed protein product [Rotaria sp. Silwood2]|nr:unnamed protein product [Rotaria sp. Silwood2]
MKSYILKPALLERFTTSDSSSKIFERLKERKQKSDETITSYYDADIKLCREYDSSMSQNMMISWLENGIKDSLKTQIKRQMKLLPESARIIQAFLTLWGRAWKINSSEQDNSEILAGSDSDLDTEIYTNSDNSTSDSDDPTSEPGDSTTHSDDSTADSDEKKEEPPSKKKRTEFLNWKHEKFVPKTFYFNNENAGITSDLKLGNDPIDYFELFFDQKIMEYIAEETNRYQQQNLSSSTASHTTQWYATNFQEMYVFIATAMLMGTVQKNTLKEYWSMDPVIITPIFRELFSRDRYLSIIRMLHFVNNDDNNSGKLYKVLPIIRHMQGKFRQFFQPFQKLCIDESLLPWKGYLSFKQYIPKKRRRFGVKLFILCDCETKYILDFIIYTGADIEIERINNLGVSGSIVMTLMKPYFQKGHLLYVDNWYTSPKLFLELYNQGTGAVGTLKEFRLQLIKNVISKYGSQKRISIGRPPTDSPLRLSARHFPSLVSPTASKTTAQRKWLKIATDEQELQEEDSSEQQATQSYVSDITNTVSTTLPQTRNHSQNVPTSTYSSSGHPSHKQHKQYSSTLKYSDSSKPQLNDQNSTLRTSSITRTQEPQYLSTNYLQRRQDANVKNYKENPSTTNYTSPTTSTPIHVKGQVNNKQQQQAIVDTRSAVTIISQKLLKTIYHRKFIYKKKLHKSANCSSINIIGEIQLEIKIQGYKTTILADVATNLITDLLLGNDWITANNVIVDSPQKFIYLTDSKRKIPATATFIRPAHLQLPVLLTDEITLPPHSKKYVKIKVLSPTIKITEALFEPATLLYSKQTLLMNALIKLNNNKSQFMIMNTNDRQKTLSKHTLLGSISYQSDVKNHFILPILPEKRIDRLTISRTNVYRTTVHHAIETGTHSPIYTSPYRVSYKDEQIQREEIDKLLKQGIIEESTSPWSSPIVLVRKKDGSVRFCIDFRKLNNITTKNAFRMPRIDYIFDHLSPAEHYTTIDFKSGYFQVGLDPKDRPKTAFSTRDQHYQFTVLRQVVTNAYLDDVIIYSPTFDQYLIHLDDILNRVNNASFRLNVNKCQIAKTVIDFLGHHIEHSNIRPNADNIHALLETKQPTTAKEAFRFVKAAEYYLLRIPDQNLPFKIQIDTSKIGIGAVLMQTHINGDLSVAYLSKKFSTTEMNWPATEQECDAIIGAIEKWHKYLDGRSLIIETDHKPLLPFNLKQQLNSKRERWPLKLQQYQFTIRYIKEKHNTVADYLSRVPVDNGANDEEDYTSTTSRATQGDNYIQTLS